MSTPRIEPGDRSQTGLLNQLICRAVGLGTGGATNVFTTLARHRRLFRPWMRFAGVLMPRGSLPRADSELLILRVAHCCGCEYEWRHHVALAQGAGLSAADVERVRQGPAAEGWSERQRLLLSAAAELLERQDISDALWAQLAGILSEPQLIELCMLVGHYQMLAMTLNALRVQPDALAPEQLPRLARVLQGLAGRLR